MRFSCPAGGLAALLICLLPVAVHAAETPNQSDQSPEVDLQAVGDRIRNTGAQIQADLRKARARLEAQKAQQAAERRREAELEAERQREADLQQQHAAQQEAAAKEKQMAAVQKRAKEEQAARERAAKALKQALRSGGERAFEEP
jgi:colicin import membrane protein